ncbi:hypothetical protein QJS10_CPB12g00603 [Acorus calamus]|uniref:Uncharacterized protein n=1 Tax=Acorus calamus TaxID=4465 RepID=A0AAV9DM66_ACOCL|nr:hypothetical protein QJS10_CPB12g00603 [Acorus calamus]
MEKIVPANSSLWMRVAQHRRPIGYVYDTFGLAGEPIEFGSSESGPVHGDLDLSLRL